jgi:hypothetical protein
MYFRLLVKKVGYLRNIIVFNNFEKITEVYKYQTYLTISSPCIGWAVWCVSIKN